MFCLLFCLKNHVCFLLASLPPSPADSGVSISDHETNEDTKYRVTPGKQQQHHSRNVFLSEATKMKLTLAVLMLLCQRNRACLDNELMYWQQVYRGSILAIYFRNKWHLFCPFILKLVVLCDNRLPKYVVALHMGLSAFNKGYSTANHCLEGIIFFTLQTDGSKQ